MYAARPVRMNTHLHGGYVAGSSDGNPYASPAEYDPGQTQRVIFPNQQSSALLWYHDHADQIPRTNVNARTARPRQARGPGAGRAQMADPPEASPRARVVRGQRLEKLGMHASDTALLALQGVRVPATAVLGEVGKGSTSSAAATACEVAHKNFRVQVECGYVRANTPGRAGQGRGRRVR